MLELIQDEQYPNSNLGPRYNILSHMHNCIWYGAQAKTWVINELMLRLVNGDHLEMQAFVSPALSPSFRRRVNLPEPQAGDSLHFFFIIIELVL